jgi:hypothetical protein
VRAPSALDQEALRFLEGIRVHITVQLERITAEGEIRARLLQEEIDRRFAELDKLSLQRHGDLKELMLTGQVSARDAVQSALAAAEKATTKAETAADRRFDSVNEFRRALTDQTATFLPRTEYDQAHTSLADRITVNGERVAALELRLTRRLDLGEGHAAGERGQRTEARLNTGTVISAALLVIALVSFVIVYVAKK